MKKDLDYYRQLPYSRVVRREEYEGERNWVVEYRELPGLVAAGETRQEALVEMKDAFDSYIEACLAWGEEIPEPSRKTTPPDGSKKSPDIRSEQGPEALGYPSEEIGERELVTTG